jgi:hypothetical protein
MVGPRYPLETLRKLRDERADAQARALAAQIARSEAAEAALHERQAARREHAERTAAALRSEQERWAAGSISGAEVRRLADFTDAAGLHGKALERAEADARATLNQERAREQQLREELAAREAEAELVRRHEAGFYQQHAERREKAEEEAAQEQWGARRH